MFPYLTRIPQRFRLTLFGLLFLLLAGCSSSPEPSSSTGPAPAAPIEVADPVLELGTEPIPAIPDVVGSEEAASVETATPPPPNASPTPIPTITPTPTFAFELSPPCGQSLPLALPAVETDYENWVVPFIDEELVPDNARPAIEFLFENPDDVSLVVYRIGYEGIGFYHNENQPMPLASISKIIHLAAYAKGVEEGRLDPNQAIEIEALEDFYLPRSDLGAHNSALRELDQDRLTLDDVAWMMIRHSANSGTDYLHDLIGQVELETVAQEIGLTNHTAPCTYLGRFLTMSMTSRDSLDRYQSDLTAYGRDTALLTDQFVNDERFQGQAVRSWQRGNQPSLSTQTRFTEALETRGTAQQYADLFAQIVTGQTVSDNGSALMRQHLEWPYEEFESNQINYSQIGYKNGRLPGILTTVYYAWPVWSDRPVVLALFYKDLPASTYQQWRRTFPHDALAHWLMSNPNGIHIMHVLRDNAEKGP